ncbi:MAG: hypothetical protein OEV43_06715 [Coriobacteriia bacterium]|nr:hypothetical protein [Coriobacteriia bacterium]
MSQLNTILIERLWFAIALVTALNLLDYRLSIAGIRWFRRGAHHHYAMDGSYELNAPFVDDVEAERPISLRHALALVRTALIIGVAWWLTVHEGRLEGVYLAILGFFVLIQVPVQMRHIQNIALFRTVVLRGGVRGRTQAARWLDLRMSGVVFWGFAGFYVLMWAILAEPFFLGGAVGAGLAGARFWIFGSDAEKGLSEEEVVDEEWPPPDCAQ